MFLWVTPFRKSVTYQSFFYLAYWVGGWEGIRAHELLFSLGYYACSTDLYLIVFDDLGFDGVNFCLR